MNIAEAAIRYKTVTLVVTVLIIGGGIMAYEKLGRLEDPEFTVKEAQVFTLYPGATAMEVAEEVTDTLETAIQKMGELDKIHSISDPGRSTIRVVIKNRYDKHTLPQVWDELRRKVNDAQHLLPPGTSTSIVYDDFGDVYGIYYAVYGDGYSYADLKEYAKMLRRELLLVQDVADVTLFGVQDEVVYLEISRARIAQLGLSPGTISDTLAGQNLVVPAGRVRVGDGYIRIQPTGEFTSVEQIGELLILQEDGTASKLRIKDVGRITRGYQDPPGTIMRFNGRPAIGIGISTTEGGNVVVMGNAVDARLEELEAKRPIGIEIGTVSHQAESVDAAINNFVLSLVEAIAIVVGVLMIAMGLRSGLLIGFILLLTVLATFILMDINGVMLERISLGALVIALGMLVDNAIVVVEGILVNLQRGMGRVEAAAKIVSQTMWPLFGATVVAVLAFAAIGVSQDSTGEYCRSLFQVILYSLMASWVLAITVTPLLGARFLKVKELADNVDPYRGIIYQGYKAFLMLCIRFRWVTVIFMLGLLVLAVYGFGFVTKSFFPDSSRPQFMLHYWRAQGTHITQTEADMAEIEAYLQSLEEIQDVTSFVGAGSLRFILTYLPEEANSAYGMFLVTVKDYRTIGGLIPRIEGYIAEQYPDAQAFIRRFILGPGEAYKIQVRFRGPDPDVLRGLAEQAGKIMGDEPDARDTNNDWRQRVPLVRPTVSEAQARNAGITRADIARILQLNFEGGQMGVYREGDELLPIIGRAPAEERGDVANLRDVQIWSPVAGQSIPLSQVVLGFETVSENSVVRRWNRLPCITVRCDPVDGLAPPVFDKLRPKIEAIPLPPGYYLEWGGDYEKSNDAQDGLKKNIPVILLLMVLTVICLFNALRTPLIIFLTVPLAVIGVTAGLLGASQPFGFMALLGFMSLAGMLIKNAIVLIDEINAQLATGKEPFAAVVDAGVSRLRPVSMAALTTVLGMIPLLVDVFFVAMAVTIMAGLTFATVLTLVVVPVLYACFYKVETA